MVPDLHKIKVPALICASFSDHQLHTRGSFRAFEQVASQQKWLYTHRTGKWASFYSEQAKAIQLKFFDYFLKGIQNDMPSHPKVTVEVRESRDNVYKIRHEHQWPIVDTQWTKLYLNHEQSILSNKDDYGNTEVDSFSTTSESLKFSYIFPQDTEVIGPMKLTLFVSLENIDDANLFIGIQKFHDGEEVDFEGSYGFANDVVSKGFMKVSLSEINEKDSLFYQPEHDFNRQKTITSDEIIKVEISLLPSATFFRQDDELRLVIQGIPLLKYGKFHQIGEYEKSAVGKCHIWSSSRYPSALLVPMCPRPLLDKA
jgi:putative CocE/NonD family hydrolase